MELTLILKENKPTKSITSLLYPELVKFGEIHSNCLTNNKLSLNVRNPRNFNVSEVYQKITSSGYSIPYSKIVVDKRTQSLPLRGEETGE